MGLSCSYPRTRVYSYDSSTEIYRSLHGKLGIKRFPGVLGRTCDRPCEPACRRGRIEDKPVAICRLKRVAADYRGDIEHLMPEITPKNGRRVACIGGGPASLTVARDLIPLGYEVIVFDRDSRGGGMMRSQIPAFRLPETVLNEEVDRILNFGAETRFNQDVTSLKTILDEDFDAVFVGTGSTKGQGSGHTRPI